MRFELLESRQLLAITLPTISNVALAAGTTVYVPLNGASTGQTVDYSVTASDYSKLTPVMMSSANQDLQILVRINGVDEVMTFQLFDEFAPTTTAKIEALVSSGYYDGLEIYRNWKDSSNNPLCLQGGNDDPTNGEIKSTPTVDSIAEEFNPNLQFTGAGLLAMARTSTASTSSSEFFITESGISTVRSSLDYNYTIFGFQTSGYDVVSTIAAMANTSGSSMGYLQTPVSITSASLFTDTQNGVLQLTAPTGVTGTVTITVVASDGTNTPITTTFTVTISADSSSNPANPFSAKIPSTPTGVTFVPTGSSSNQTNSTHGLSFIVSGVTSGNTVQVLADGNVIGQAVAAGGSVTVTTNSTVLPDGAHKFTAIQVATDQTATVTETNGSSTTGLNKTADVPSLNSPFTQVTIDTVAPVFTDAPLAQTAVVGVPYQYQMAVTDGTSAGITYALTAKPTDMNIDTNTGLITWTPGSSQTGTANVTVQATDPAGNVSQPRSFTINVLAANAAPELSAATPSLGSYYANSPIPINLTDFVKNVTDSDASAVVGGIALVGTTGKGTWEYKLSSATTYTAVGSVSESTALLLPHDAALRYTPSATGEIATITYHAWDTTGGTAATRSNLSTSGATGGSTAYSVATNTASLTVLGTCAISGYVYIDADNDGLRTRNGQTHIGIQGVVITLSNYTSGSWSSITMTMTDANGFYQFDNLPAGAYLVKETQPARFTDGKDTRGTISGTTRGILGPDQFAMNLAAAEKATNFNFGERGLKMAYVTAEMVLGSSRSLPTILAGLNSPPVVDLAKSVAGTSYSTTFSSGTSPSPVAIAASDATITDSDSAMLASMTVTITNPLDGDYEKLAVTIPDAIKGITASAAGNVLTLSGIATVANYQEALRLVKYRNDASTSQVHEGSRTISVVVNDGIADSTAAVATVTVAVDNTLPTVALSAPSASNAAGGPITYTVTYADANFNSSTLAASNVTLNTTGTATGTVSVSTVDSTTRLVTISGITGEGTLGISLAADTASDLAGNLAPAAGPSTTFLVDNTKPTVTIGAPSASITTGGSITYTVTYADTNFNSSTLAASNITLNKTGTANGTVTVSTVDSTTRLVTISGITGDGTLGISLAAGTASDLAGNLALAAGPSTTFIVDSTGPTVSLSQPSAASTTNGPVTYSVIYSDANFSNCTLTASNITLNKTGNANGTVTISTVDSTTRLVTISDITGDGTLGISLAAGTASDLAGNLALAAGPTTTFVVGNPLPTVNISEPSASIAAAGPIAYTVTYADVDFNSSTLTASDITLNMTGTANGTVTVSTVDSTTRLVTISGITGDGTLGISLAEGTASDLAGDLAPAAGPSTTFIVDNTRPTVSLSQPSATSTTNGPVTYSVIYSDAYFSNCTLTASDITLNKTGTADGTVTVSTVDSTTRLVTISGITGNGTLSISLAAGTASDLAGNLALAIGPTTTFIVNN
jgi:cyclophilin family peptidyl-prolyl cis-trans isomerase